MICKNIKHSIFLSVLFFVGSVQSGYAQEASDMETVPEMQAASFTPPFDFPIVFSGNFQREGIFRNSICDYCGNKLPGNSGYALM